MALNFTVGRNVADWQISKASVLERINMLLKTEQWSDCTFFVKGQNKSKIFKAHRLILASTSPVFEAMCYGPLAEQNQIVITDMEPHIFSTLLEYIYGDYLKLRSVEDASNLLYAAKKYMLHHLSQLCVDYMCCNLRPSNVSSVFEFAQDMQESELLNSCIKIMRENTKQVILSPEDRISSFALATVLDQNMLSIDETELFDCVVRWAGIECEECGLEKSVENIRLILSKLGLFSKIRFLAMTLETFKKGPETSGILTKLESDTLSTSIEKLNNNEKSDLKVPHGWCSIFEPRMFIRQKLNFCCRQFLKTALTVSGNLRLLTKIRVARSITVRGIRVFTRLTPSIDISVNSTTDIPTIYKENLNISVLDSQSNTLCQTVFSDVVEYNTHATVMLSEAVHFNSNEEYSILTVLPCNEEPAHEYPLSFMSEVETTRDIKFQFCDLADLTGSGSFVRRLDMGFLNAIAYSV